MAVGSIDSGPAVVRPLPSRLVRGCGSPRREVSVELANAWCAEYAAAPNEGLRERIVAAHQWLVRICARQMRRREESLDDLVQVGNIGLLKALDRFDPAFNVSFHSYASATIIGELRRHYRGVWQLRVPRSLQERHLAANRAVDELTARLGRSPSCADVAGHLGLTIAEVLEALEVGTTTWIGALSDDEALGAPRAIVDGESNVDERLVADALLATLKPRARAMLVLWLVDGLTQDEIGRRVGLSQVQVSRSVRRSLAQLRALAARGDQRCDAPAS